MSKQYYILNGKNKSGPFLLAELQQQELNTKTLIWSDDMADWKPASDVDEVKQFIKKEIPKPPLTPAELATLKNKKAFIKAAENAVLWLLIITAVSFLIMGGFASDDYLEKVYYNLLGENGLYTYPSEIRWIYIPLSSLIFISLPLSILILLFNYRINKAQPESEKIITKKAINQSIIYGLVLPVILSIGLVADANMRAKIKASLKEILPYLAYTIILIVIVIIILFFVLYREYKKEQSTLTEAPINSHDDELQSPNDKKAE